MRSIRRALLGFLLACLDVALLLGLAEASLRLAGRLRHGTWPRTRAAAFYDEILLLRRIYRPHAYLNTGPREGSAVAVFGKSVAINRLTSSGICPAYSCRQEEKEEARGTPTLPG